MNELGARVDRIGELAGRRRRPWMRAALNVHGRRLQTKLADLEAKVDQDRFEQELVFYLEKMDVTEEKVRLRSHCTYFHRDHGPGRTARSQARFHRPGNGA